MMTEAADLTYNDVVLGQRVSFTRTILEEEGELFARISGDYNPLHMDTAYASATPFGARVVHGAHLASLLSCLVGMYCPGKRSLYISQTLQFRSPVLYGETVTIEGTVIQKTDSTKVVRLTTEIRKEDGSCAVSGEACVQMLR